MAAEELDPQQRRHVLTLASPVEKRFALESPPMSPETAPEALETTESAPGNASATPSNGRFDIPVGPADAARPEMAPEPIDIMGSAPGNGTVSEALTQLARELASGMYAPPATNPDGTKRVGLRLTPSGVMAC